jgi:peptidoglycan/LPS O-acetylase OafA/YrhL
MARPVPAFRSWLLAALGTGAGALAIRQIVPTGENVFGLQLGFFSSYLVLFAVGIAAWRCDWLRRLSWSAARPWVRIMAFVWLLMPVSMVVVSARHEIGKVSFSGGLSWTAVFYALWEPFVAWGAISAWLLSFRARMNRSSRFWDWLSRRAYAVYILHPPVLVTIALLLHGWGAPPLVKFLVVGSLTCAATWLVADPLVRLPGVRRIV